MNKRDKIIYWIATGLLTVMMLMSAGMYIFNHEAITEAFITLGYPTYIIYPLAVAKILGLIAILTNASRLLKEWAYAGFFFDFVLAAAAHISVKDGEEMGALIALALLLVSYIFGRKR
ncbi:DoxX family protein [Carboxylicivirga mesophila]|uniref:DoxX family protein n=1 Tax=Carboxylicivirga mesophila TaxID=1166478 RepID=A0ABS5KFN6_9BACT|nr:DoxX family protein [Carboxylicivirga mesophila]MBS2213724.1 DoxX family protein [Carboxylicivirga mesophila]